MAKDIRFMICIRKPNKNFDEHKVIYESENIDDIIKYSILKGLV
jgi:hypothetical protein